MRKGQAHELEHSEKQPFLRDHPVSPQVFLLHTQLTAVLDHFTFIGFASTPSFLFPCPHCAIILPGLLQQTPPGFHFLSCRCPNPMLEFSKCNYGSLIPLTSPWFWCTWFETASPHLVKSFSWFMSYFLQTFLYPNKRLNPAPHPNLGSNCFRMSHYVRLLSSYSVIRNLRLGLRGLLAPS